MTIAESKSSRLQMTRVAVFTFQLIRQNLPGVFALSTMVAVPAGILRYQEGVFPDANIWNPPIALPLAAYMVSASLLAATIVKTLVPDGDGHFPSLKQGLVAVVSDLLPLSLIAFISGVAVLAGVFLLLIPGLLLGVILVVVVPVRAVERTSFIRTFARSAILTRGEYWPILGLLIASIAIEVSGNLVVNVMMGDAVFAGYTEDTRSDGTAAIIATAIIDAATSLIGAAGTAVVYCELRRIKDGPAPRELASEFD